MKDFYDAVIVGGGPAGLSAAIYLARAQYSVLVVEKEKIGGQITITSQVVNYPGVFSTDGNRLTGEMRSQARSFGAEFLLANVSALDMDGDKKRSIQIKERSSVLAWFWQPAQAPGGPGLKAKRNFADGAWLTVRPATGNFLQEKMCL